MTNLESRVPIDDLGLLRELQRTNGIVRWTNGFSEDVDHRPHSLHDTTNGTRNTETKSKSHDALR